jgi:hypothetical protein
VSGLSRLGTVTFTVDGQVATVTLNRPERLNSFNRTMVSEFDQIWHEVRDNDEIHAVVLRAAGEPEIARRRPLAVQGTVRAIWESLDLPASVGARMGMFYTLLGNETQPAKPPGTRTKPRFR